MSTRRMPIRSAPTLEEALRLASGDAGRDRAAPAAPATQTPPQAAAQRPTAPCRRRAARALSARPAGAEDRAGGLAVHWTVVRGGRAAASCSTRGQPTRCCRWRAGRYVVEARDGPVSAHADGRRRRSAPTVAAVPLNAGTLRVRAHGAEVRRAAQRCHHHHQRGRAGGDGKPALGAPVAVFKGGEGVATLPAGRYLVRVEQGLVRAERSVVVPAGSQGRIDIPLNGARVLLSAVGPEGAGAARAAGVQHRPRTIPDAPSGRREVARSAARQAEFMLPPGTYYVIARLGSVEARERAGARPRRRGAAHAVACRRAVSRLSTKPSGGARRRRATVSYRDRAHRRRRREASPPAGRRRCCCCPAAATASRAATAADERAQSCARSRSRPGRCSS